MMIAVLISIYVMVSLWEYCMFFYNQGILPNPVGFNGISIIQWIIAGIGLIHLFGWIYGILGLIFAITLLQYITHFTLGLVYNFLFGNNTRVPLALFALSILATGILTVISFIDGFKTMNILGYIGYAVLFFFCSYLDHWRPCKFRSQYFYDHWHIVFCVFRYHCRRLRD